MGYCGSIVTISKDKGSKEGGRKEVWIPAFAGMTEINEEKEEWVAATGSSPVACFTRRDDE